ncbi:hypothetical protein [Nocardia terpenica]|uniref:Uncharacterized protein n=1 Tax=Nocardia terpenica TaxID=455432 RepID=A0A291RCS7_9NOCA|nr:hypothetical protein [Nocardia terpenica]ATL65109.1 hypothetical protein CRH09_01555 [Nocardia terpenica]
MVSNPFREGAARHTGPGVADQLLRSSMLAAEARYFPGSRTRVIVRADGPLPPDASSALAPSLAAAAAMFSTGRDMFSAGPPTSGSGRADLADMVSPRAATSRTLVFAVAATAPDPGSAVTQECDGGPRCAMYDLCRTLPSTPDDDLTLAAIASLPQRQRTAVALLATAVAELDRSVTVEFRGRAGTDHAALSRAQAQALRTAPRDTGRRKIVTATGVLDAARTRRRTFYLECAEGDLHGSVDDTVLPQLPELIARRVTVRLEHVVSQLDSGRTPASIYRLLDVIAVDPASPGTR